MLVQALAEYADNCLSDQMNQKAWESKPVPYFLSLQADGKFLGIVSNNMPVTRGKKSVSVPAPLLVPKSPVPRTAGLHPLLAADDIRYVLGPGAWTQAGKEQQNEDLHQAFVRLIKRAAEETGDEGLQAAAAFYQQTDQLAAARAALAEAKAGSIVALALINEPLVKRTPVKAHWSSHYAIEAGDRVAQGGDAECLISGKLGPIAPTHDKIKGLASLGGQAAGVSLMSFDKEAFRSYGWEQNANSPVSADRAMAYVLALNDLLRNDGKHRRNFEGVGFIFWTKDPSEFDPMSNIEQPNEEQVSSLLSLSGHADPDPNMFYMAGVAGNGGRMIVRYWVSEKLAEVKISLKDWFQELRIADVYTGQIAPPPKLWQLLYAIDREGKPPADRVVSLIRRAIEGPCQPLGSRLLSAALARLRVSSTNRLDAVRAGLIRLCVNDNIRLRNKGERPLEQTLDPAQHHAAYLCGRLLAVYESLQYTASGEVNQTVSDRYYTLASTFPVRAFCKLQELGNKHLRKLRRDRPGAMVSIGRDIDQLHLQIEQASGFKFPKALDLDGQGRFALGYHHQRAYNMAQAQAGKHAKEQQALDQE